MGDSRRPGLRETTPHKTTLRRLACVDIPALPLQSLLRKHPRWQGLPAAVVDRDDPQGILRWINEEARRNRLETGMRYGAALSLDRNLRAGVVPAGEIRACSRQITQLLQDFSPEVEPSPEDPGLFWLNASGLGLLYDGPAQWAVALQTRLRNEGFHSVVAVGFTRFGTLAAARMARAEADSPAACRLPPESAPPCPRKIFATPEEEARMAGQTSLQRLTVEPRSRNTLARLGIDTIEQLLALPASGLRRRFGPELMGLCEMARGEGWTPLQAAEIEEPLRQSLILEDILSSSTTILFLVRRLLGPLLQRLAEREEALEELRIDLELDQKSSPEKTKSKHEKNRANSWIKTTIKAHEPTLDEALITDLTRLRLDALNLRSGVRSLTVELSGAPASREQLQLFAARPRRDPVAANRALARVRAEFGEGAVLEVRLRAGHLPEARFTLEEMEQLEIASPRKVRRPPLLRRILDHPQPLETEPGTAANPPAPASPSGPSLLSGGWWRQEVRRQYHFLTEDDGEIQWVFLDTRRNRWRRQGRVE